MTAGTRLLATVLCMLLCGLASTIVESACDPTVELLITEFMAANLETLTDEDGSYEDWIELYNPCLPSVDVGGWYLTDDPSNLTKWRLPSITLVRSEFLLVFASRKDRAVAGSPLHTNFKLDGAGEYLALVEPDGTTIAQEFEPFYPQQFPDVSYGLRQAPLDLVSQGDTASYQVPTPADSGIGTAWTTPAWDDSTWEEGPTGLGFTTSGADGFDVTYHKANITITSLSEAEAVIGDPGLQLSTANEMAQVINYLNAGPNGHYGNDNPYPSLTINQDVDDFAVLATATVLIPTAGDWTFGVSSDDGFGLDLTRDPFVFHSEFPGIRGVDDTLSVFAISEAGAYSLRLVHFEAYAGAGVELFAAEGSHAAFNSSFRLVGDTASGALALGNIGARLETDVQSVMQDVNASLWSRVEFPVADPAAFDLLTLRVAYEDGFVAYLNGTEVASSNAPSPVFWDSTALVDRPIEDAGTFDTIDLTDQLHLLTPGTNVLALHGLNDGVSDGDFLALAELSAAGDTVDAAPPQFFPDATPGAFNSEGFPGVSGIPLFSHPSGSFVDPFSLSISAVAPDAAVRYTTDGSEPTESSGTLYTVPILIDDPTRIRARLFEPGLAPGPVQTRLYSRIDAALANFESNLPIVIVNTFGSGISADFYTENLISVIPKVADRVSITDPAQFEGLAGIKARGTTSLGFPKKQYALETWDTNFEDLDVELLDMPAESDWILNGPYSDKMLMRNVLAYQWSNDIGRYAVRTQFVEMYLQTGSGPVDSSDYVGVYVLFEKIKRSPHRVPITQLQPNDNAEPEITGGYILKKDRLDPGDSGFLTSTGQLLEYVDPKEVEISAAQAEWIQGYLHEFEQALYGPDFADPVLGYAKYIDVPSFIDHHILVEGTKNVDGFRHSTFMFKDRGGKLQMGPIWDYNHCLGNANVRMGWVPELWYYDTLTNHIEYPWYLRLFEDEAFVLAYADRWYELRRDAFSTEKMLADIDRYNTLLNESQERNFIRWPILGIYVWPNWFIADTHQEEVDWVKWFLETRLNWIDAQFFAPPVFNHPAGEVPLGFPLTITSRVGDVYYTLNGTDPRLPDGSISPTALGYTIPIPLTVPVQVQARALDGGTWSALNMGLFDPLPLSFVNEVLPDNQTVHTDEQGEFDPWIELYNPSSNIVDLGGLYLTDDIGVPDQWAIPSGTTVCPHLWLLIWADSETGEGLLHANFTLDPAGGTIYLFDGAGYQLDSLTYPGLGPDESYGRRPDGGTELSRFSYPTPDAANPRTEIPILVNEFNAVAPGKFLGNGGSDLFWGQVPGNGGEWFELVVVQDRLDIRDWSVTVEDSGGAVSTTLNFADDPVLSNLRSGTILTVGTGGLPSDVGYDPANGDWWIHLRAGVFGDGLYISDLDFTLSNENSRITIFDESAMVVYGPAGEGIHPLEGIGSDEVFKLEEDPGPLTTPLSNYNGGTTSTFGAPNQWSGGALEQSFVVLRSAVQTSCTLDEQCHDGNPCTDDACIVGTCENAANAVSCDDGNPCTQTDVCSAGRCRGQIMEDCCIVDCECDDGDACTTDRCVAGICVSDLAPTGTPCDDGNLCTLDGACDQGLCMDGDPVDCTAFDDDCNLGLCNPVDGLCEMQATNEAGACDDGDLCYTAKTCALGSCVGGVPVDCASLDDVCEVGICTPGVGCEAQSANEGGICDDGASCTSGETCHSGNCAGGASNCPTGETCNIATDSCEPISNYLPVLLGHDWRYIINTTGEPDPSWRDTGFDDWLWASGPGGLCYGADCPDECNTDLSAMIDSSVTTYYRRRFHVDNPAAVQSLSLTITYDDGFVAFINGVEAARSNVWGACSVTVTTLCQSDADCPGEESCLLPTYDQLAGNPPGTVPGNHECDTGGSGGPGGDEIFDLSAAIANLQPGTNVIAVQGHNLTVDSTDFVQSPKLSAVESPFDCTDDSDCDDGNPCTADTCDSGTTCISTVDDDQDGDSEPDPCDDGDLCTVAEVCAGGICGGVAMDCSGLDDQCNLGICNDVTGTCELLPLTMGTPCDDANACTVGDSCDAGTCLGDAVDCSGLDDSCNVGICNPGDGGCEAQPSNEGAGCDDGAGCSVGDTCASGVCSGMPLDCDDGNACSTDDCVGGICDHVPSGVCSLSGSVLYYRGGGSEPSLKPVPDVEIDLDGDATVDLLTDAGGGYFMPDAAGSFTIAPLPKYGDGGVEDENGSITGTDASIIAEYSVGMTTPSALQFVAADVSGDGNPTPYDAALVAQVSVQLLQHFPVAVAAGSDWAYYRCDNFFGENDHDCTSPVYVHDPLMMSESGDFYALLYGDVTGNWAPAGTAHASTAVTAEVEADWQDRWTAMTLAGNEGAGRALGTDTPRVPVETSLQTRVTELTSTLKGRLRRIVLSVQDGEALISLGLSVRYDPRAVEIQSVEATDLTQDFLLISHDTGGLFRAAAWTFLPLAESGDVLVLTVLERPTAFALEPLRLELLANEKPLVAEIDRSVLRARP